MPRIPLSQAGLFLDLDGTLAPIVADPAMVRPDRRRTELLRAAQAALEGRLAVISGRSIEQIDDILEGAVARASGLHGLERRTAAARIARVEPPPGMPLARAAAQALVAAHQGLLLEDKGLSLAIHYRAAPELQAQVEAFAAKADAWGLVAQHGKMVCELRAPGPHKGDAVAEFLKTPPFLAATPVFVGDDLTDEHGFAAAIAHGGYGILVGAPRATAAQGRLADPAAVLDWIERSLEDDAFEI